MLSAIHAPESHQESQKSLRYLLLRYRFLLLALLLISTGLFLELFHERFALAEFVRDLGITLLLAGTVGLGIEFYTRRDFLELVADKLSQAIDTSNVSKRVEDLMQLHIADNDLQTFGVRRMYKKRPRDLFYQLVDDAEPGSEIKIMGICLMSLNEAKMRDSISAKLREGCKIKLLLMDPDSPAVEQRALDENRRPNEVRAEIEASEQLHRIYVQEGTAEENRHNMEIGYYANYPNHFIFCTKQALVVGFYLRGQRGDEIPHLELDGRGGGLCDPFLRDFDFAWENRREATSPMLPFKSM